MYFKYPNYLACRMQLAETSISSDMPGNQQQPSPSGDFYQTMDSAEANARVILTSSACEAPVGTAKVSDSRLTGTGEIGVPVPVPSVSRHDAAPIESDVSIGPLLTGITMMVLMRHHRF